ncbi:hypothetical protein J4E90_010251 [Alternaria incomplexa]|uniref:uncharacterized protein n=1 Tax=Alternaria incomplexa TaxID=1187928 RepID=UPI0022201A9F|nr:uncharacterized protein J4E90_010251 [Alternaria incomplexa]KAI4906791.1 hypothetical protein J4E90_010251 [Alternaria incomplexa]
MDDGSASYALARMHWYLGVAARAREEVPANMGLSRVATNFAYNYLQIYLRRMNEEEKEEQEREQVARAEAEEARRLQNVSIPMFWNCLRPAARDRAFRRAFLRTKLQGRRR